MQLYSDYNKFTTFTKNFIYLNIHTFALFIRDFKIVKPLKKGEKLYVNISLIIENFQKTLMNNFDKKK